MTLIDQCREIASREQGDLATCLRACADELESLRRDAERWRALPALFAKEQLDYPLLEREVDAAIAKEPT
jgi:transposase